MVLLLGDGEMERKGDAAALAGWLDPSAPVVVAATVVSFAFNQFLILLVILILMMSLVCWNN